MPKRWIVEIVDPIHSGSPYPHLFSPICYPNCLSWKIVASYSRWSTVLTSTEDDFSGPAAPRRQSFTFFLECCLFSKECAGVEVTMLQHWKWDIFSFFKIVKAVAKVMFSGLKIHLQWRYSDKSLVPMVHRQWASNLVLLNPWILPMSFARNTLQCNTFASIMICGSLTDTNLVLYQ